MNVSEKNIFNSVLLVGHGGYAKNILYQIRKFYYQKTGSVRLPGLEYLYLGQDSSKLLDVNSSKSISSKIEFNETEFINIESTTSSIESLKDIYQLESFKELPWDWRNIDFNIQAKQQFSKPMGKLLFYQKDSTQSQFLNAKNKWNSGINFLSKRNIESKPYVFVLGSIFGGTGSVFLNDIPLILKGDLNNINFIGNVICPTFSLNQFFQSQEEKIDIQVQESKIYNEMKFIGFNYNYLSELNQPSDKDVINFTSKLLFKQISSLVSNQIEDPNFWILYQARHIDDESKLRNEFGIVNQEVLNFLRKNPHKFYQLHPRNFEDVIAEIWKNMGYSVKLTPASRDGGVDIYAVETKKKEIILYTIECKKYKKSSPVGVKIVREIYGVSRFEAIRKNIKTVGVIVTTSSYTKDACDFQRVVKSQLHLKDYNDLIKWLNDLYFTKKI